MAPRAAPVYFTATAPLPANRKLRNSNKARYVAKIGSEASLALKLARRMLVTKVTAADKVTISGKVIGPLAMCASKVGRYGGRAA